MRNDSWLWDVLRSPDALVYEAQVTYPRKDGLCLVTDVIVSEGETIRLSYPESWPKGAWVSWVGAGEFACTFNSPLTDAELKSVPGVVRFITRSESARLKMPSRQRRKTGLSARRVPKVNLWPLTEDDL